MFFAILGAYFIQGVLKGQLSICRSLNIYSTSAKELNVCSIFLLGYVWKWFKEDDVKGRCKTDILFKMGNHYFIPFILLIINSICLNINVLVFKVSLA